jgi:hypothetical protein
MNSLHNMYEVDTCTEMIMPIYSPHFPKPRMIKSDKGIFVAGSSPDEVIGFFFNWPNLTTRKGAEK